MELTQTGSIIGTPKYMSPEQALCRPVSPQTDLYSLGVVLYHMLSGAPPFVGSEPLAIIAMHLHEPPPPFETRCPQIELPPDFDALVFQLLAKSPADRPSSAAEVVERLQAIQKQGSLPRFPVRLITGPFAVLPETHNGLAANHTPSSPGYPGDADLDLELAAFAVDGAVQDDLDLGAFSLDDPTTAEPDDDFDLTAFASARPTTLAGSAPAASAPRALCAEPSTSALPAPASIPPATPSDQPLPSLPPIPSRSPASLPPAAKTPRDPSRRLLIALAAGALIVLSLLAWWISSQLQP